MSSVHQRSCDSLSAYRRPPVAMIALAVTWAVTATDVPAADEPDVRADAASSAESVAADSELTDRQWGDLDRAVDRGLEFLATQQQADGSFETLDYAQPAVTSFCVLAFLSRGHTPAEGPYAEKLTRAIDFVLSTQQPSGLLCTLPPNTKDGSTKGTYNHAISGVMLGEAYGIADSGQQARIRTAIESALAFTRRLQQIPKAKSADRGGWRYLIPPPYIRSDLSCTAWHLMFYRSARNAGFDVQETDIKPAVEFVRRCFDSNAGSFAYILKDARYPNLRFSRAMAGAGILSLSLAGEHQSEMAKQAAGFVLAHPFDQFNSDQRGVQSRYYYEAYHCSQGMFQLGGDVWAEFYSVLLQTLVENQRNNGSWEREAGHCAELGFCYSTSLAVLSLTPPYQLLPVYQR